MANNSKWKQELSALIRANNVKHAVRDKDVSFNTQQARRQGLFRIFGLLRTMGFHMAPRNLSGRDIEVLMAYWMARPRPGTELPESGIGPSWPKIPYSAAYIQQQLSFLRVFACWIGKKGLVKAAERYVDDPKSVRRSGHTCCGLVRRASNGWTIFSLWSTTN